MTATGRHLWVLLLLAGPGCAYNPGYVPFYFPGGPVSEQHAKPGGAYFHNFDRKACKLEVTPPRATAPVGSSIVLVASVFDNDGQARRSRRVEWLVEGVGNIVEVDESGWYPGRGFKKDNKYAVSHTKYVRGTLTRGNDDPGDDVVIQPGQTFCVLSSAVPGETTLTAYAPGVFNWDQGKVVVKVCWGDGAIGFPPPAVARYGSEHTLSTTLGKKADGTFAGSRVRYRILDGPQGTVLVARAGTDTGASQSGTDAREAEAFADGTGAAEVRLVQREPRAGRTRVFVEVVQAPENGVGPPVVVGRQETVVEWAAPVIQVDAVAPPAAGVNGTIPVTITLLNRGAVGGREGRVTATVPDGLSVVSTDPPVTGQNGPTLEWTVPPLGPGEKRELVVRAKPSRVGEAVVTVAATTADGLQADTRAVTKIDQGRLQAVVEGPAAVLAGDRVPVTVAVTNPAAVTAENVTVWARFDDGLTADGGKNPVELAVGSVPGGGSRTVEVPLTAGRAGRFQVRATVTADGDVSAASEPLTVAVQQAAVGVSVRGPARVYVGQELTWVADVTNGGQSPLSNLTVRATLPADVRFVKADADGKSADAGVEWVIDRLNPGESRSVSVTAAATALADRAPLAVAVAADTPGGRKVEAAGEWAAEVIGAPAVVLELATPGGPVEVGRSATYRVRVRNGGTVSARGLDVSAAVPREFKPVRGTGPGPAAAVDPKSGAVTFPVLDELRPGQVVEFAVEVQAVTAGDARFRAEVRAPHLKNPLREEQSTRVVGGRSGE